MLECLADLDERLDGRLVFRHGPPERELPALAREAKAAEMHGVDPQPFYRRMYNPARHQERFDPRGEYVRRYVPELRDVPDDYLAEPWSMPGGVQRDCGCLIGSDYPEPIVDRRAARREAAERFAVASR